MSKTVLKGHNRTTEAMTKIHKGTLGQLSTPFYTGDEILRYLTEEEKQSLQQEVVTALNNELIHAEELEVAVPRLLRSCSTESRELRASINSISSSQIVEAERAMQIVKSCRARVEELRESFLKQGRLIQGMGTETPAYVQLRKLHILRENVTAVVSWSKALKEVRYENMFAIVQQHEIRTAYERLKKLQKIRKTLIAKAGANYRSFQTVFEPYFAKQDAVLAMFVNEVIFILEEDSMNVSIQKALEDNDDGSPFPQFDVLKECIQVCSEEIKQPVLNTGSDGVEREPPISQETVRAALQKSVGKLWEEQIMVDVVDPFGQISVYLEQMKKIELILEALEMTLIPLSSSFSFFGEVVLAVHGEVMHVMEGYVDPDADVEANGLMEASEFIQWYKEMMVSCNFAQYVSIASIDELSAQFMANAVEGLSEHLTRLCRACAITVCNDAKGPTVLPSGQPITTGPVDMFAVLQQSLGGLTTAVETDVMRQIGSAVAAAICAYLDECKTRSDFDYCEEENASSANPESDEVWQTRRMQYLYAFCNDCATIESNLDTIEIKFASCWEDAGDGDFSNTPFQKVQDTLPENALYYLNEITLHVERVVESQWQLVARSGPWYTDEENPVQLIVETLAEYIDEEFTVMLPDQRQRKLIIQMLVRYVVKYFNTLLEFLGDVIRNPKKYVVESWATFLECYIRDCNIAMQMWRDRITDTRVQVVDSVAKAFEVVKDLLSVKKPVDFQFIIKNNLLEDFGDCPTFFIKFTLNARTKELDSSSRDRMLGIWNESIAFQQRDKDDKPTTGWNQPPSFFAKVDRTIEHLEQRSGLLRKSAKKKREEEEQRKLLETKEAKRLEREKRKETDRQATLKKKTRKRRDVIPDSAVETANLEDILKS